MRFGRGPLARLTRQRPAVAGVPASGPVAADAASNSGYQTAQPSFSWSHTCAGANRYLAVDVVTLSSPAATVTALTYAGEAMTLVGARSTTGAAGRVESWGLVNPAAGANTVAVTLSGASDAVGLAASYTGVHQATPTEAFNSAQATNGIPADDATATVTPTTDGCMVHAATITDDTSITPLLTSLGNVTGAAGSSAAEETGPVTPPAATAVGFTGVGSSKTWAVAGYAIRPAA